MLHIFMYLLIVASGHLEICVIPLTQHDIEPPQSFPPPIFSFAAGYRNEKYLDVTSVVVVTQSVLRQFPGFVLRSVLGFVQLAGEILKENAFTF